MHQLSDDQPRNVPVQIDVRRLGLSTSSEQAVQYPEYQRCGLGLRNPRHSDPPGSVARGVGGRFRLEGFGHLSIRRIRDPLLAHGFLRLHCDECGHDRLVAFSRKRRGFCPSCGGRRMARDCKREIRGNGREYGHDLVTGKSISETADLD
jgi:hypothetical protein